MEYNEREKLVTSVISGVVSCSLGDKIYLIREPSLIDKVIADQIYEDKLTEAELRGIKSSDQLLQHLTSVGMWGKNDQAELDTMPKRIENLKVQLYQAYFKYQGRDPIRKNLARLKTANIKLLTKRDTLKKESAEGIAVLAKNKYLICSNVTDIEGNKLWGHGEYIQQNSKLVDSLMSEFMMSRLSDDEIRELARTEPWRTLWSVAKSDSLFGVPAIHLTNEQKNLIIWSRIYDNVYEHSECPPDEIIKEDDMLEGWLILQSRKRDDERKQGHSFGGNKKGPSGSEIFLFADSEEDAERIRGMNDSQGQSVIKQRMSSLKNSGGKLDETKMPDSQLSMRQQAMQQMKEHLQRGR